MASITQSNERSHKKQKRKEKQSSAAVEQSVPSSPKKVKLEDKTSDEPKNTSSVSTATLGWATDDLNTLINNLAKCLPKNDSAKYSTLIEKLDWDKVKFGTYGAQECKQKWFQVMNRLRRYRTLTDMVSDARVWLKAPWQTYNNSRKVKHPDLPKKPLTPFFRYFMEKRVKCGKSNPGSSVTDLAKLLSTKFAALNERKKQKYKESYDKEYEEYKHKIEIFKREHPEVEFGSMNKTQSSHGHAQEGPPKPRTPVQLFMEEKSKKIPANSENRKEAIDRIRHSWSQLSEGKRIKWIRRALLDEKRYETDLLEYIKEHPSFEPIKSKSVLTKNEKELKDRFDGKPERPPNSGYSYFSKMLLRELKEIPSKEKMVVIAKRWKELSESDRLGYNREAQKANTKYIEKFNVYLEHLPESEREKVLRENKLKLPSEKKLKQQQSLPKLQTPPNTSDKVDDPNAREQVAVMHYQMDRTSELQEKYPEKSKPELTKIILQEWRDKLTDKKKAKYYKFAEKSVAQFLSTKTDASTPTKASNVKEKPSPAAQELIKKEPKKPPKSGYALFTSEQLSSLTDFEPKKRMTEIARKWNQEMSKQQKESYDLRIKQMTADYQKKLSKFTASLSPSEQIEYQNLQNERSRPKQRAKSKSIKAENPDPVVDDSNVIETIDVSTSGNANHTSDDSDEESDNDGSDNEEEEEGEGEGEGGEEQEEEEGESDDEEEEEEEEEEEGDDDEDSSD